jgi:orotate phosphoribosyltransferase
MIQLAVEKGVVSGEQQGILLNWQKDPANWKGL